jgi:ornithine cyclodeaminase/alanine dehydrogenase-like protein (mu-crystallin family)
MNAMRLGDYPDAALRYLTRAQVIDCCGAVDMVRIVEDALCMHARGEVLLPGEAYLGWRTTDGSAARSLAMPGGLWYDQGLALGVKVMNGSLANSARGLARAEGLLILFDPETAWPTTVMEAAYVSAMRTAAVTAVTATHLGAAGSDRLAVFGCGTLARAHLRLLADTLARLKTVSLHDSDAQRASQLADELRRDRDFGLEVVLAADARECVRGAGLVVPVTTATDGYIGYDWLRPGAVVANVSLDDVLPDVVAHADLVLVDDWGLVSGDSRRLIGRQFRAGLVRAPDGSHHPDCVPAAGARRIDGTIGDILIGRHPGRRAPEDIILTNPFGMSILDVAVGHAVSRVATECAIGTPLRR